MDRKLLEEAGIVPTKKPFRPEPQNNKPAKITDLNTGLEIDAAKLSRVGPPTLTVWPDGYIRDFVDWLGPGTDAPDEFRVCAALQTITTAAAHRDLYIRFGAGRVYSNLWLLLIAASSFFRKTTCISRAKETIQAACPNKIMADRLTPESFYESLSKNPEGLFTLNEFGGFLKAMSRNYMQGFQADLTELYDTPSVFTRQRKDKKGELATFTINRPIISIFSGSTLDWLTETLKESDAGSGFLPRFLFCSVTERRRPLMIVPREIEPAPGRLVNILSNVSRLSGEVKFNELSPGYAAYESFFLDLVNELEKCTERKSVMAGFITRLQIYALKIALSLEAAAAAKKGLTQLTQLSEESVEWGTYLTHWFYGNMRWLLANELTFSEHDKQRKKVIDILREAEGVMAHSQLMRALGMLQKPFAELIETMVETGDVIEGDTNTERRGRPGKKYILAELVMK